MYSCGHVGPLRTHLERQKHARRSPSPPSLSLSLSFTVSLTRPPQRCRAASRSTPDPRRGRLLPQSDGTQTMALGGETKSQYSLPSLPVCQVGITDRPHANPLRNSTRSGPKTRGGTFASSAAPGTADASRATTTRESRPPRCRRPSHPRTVGPSRKPPRQTSTRQRAFASPSTPVPRRGRTNPLLLLPPPPPWLWRVLHDSDPQCPLPLLLL